VRLASDPGESLGGGATLDYSKANALVTVHGYGAQLAVRVVGDRVWDGFLALGSGEPRLRAGTFAALTNIPPGGGAGFRWSSQELTCGSSVATVTIDSVKYDGDVLRATGELKLSHAELGLEPFSALGGALSVADAFTVHYKITAHAR